MTLKGIVAGDILECDIRGDVFYGKVSDLYPDHTQKGQVLVYPIGNGRPKARFVTSRQIRTRFKRMATK
jgi:hypothetical protein